MPAPHFQRSVASVANEERFSIPGRLDFMRIAFPKEAQGVDSTGLLPSIRTLAKFMVYLETQGWIDTV